MFMEAEAVAPVMVLVSLGYVGLACFVITIAWIVAAAAYSYYAISRTSSMRRGQRSQRADVFHAISDDVVLISGGHMPQPG